MGKSEGSNAEGKALNFRSGQKENRGGAASTVGPGEGAAEEGGVAIWGACCAEYVAGLYVRGSSTQYYVTVNSQSP